MGEIQVTPKNKCNIGKSKTFFKKWDIIYTAPFGILHTAQYVQGCIGGYTNAQW